MKTTFRSLAFLIMLAAPVLLAQPPRAYFPWWDSPLARDINLTEDQRRQVQDVVRDYRGKLIDARAAVQKAEGDVEDLFNEDQVDTRRAGEAVDKLIVARGELTRAFAQMSLKLRTILTQQQWQELRQRRAKQPPRGDQQRLRMRQGRPERPPRPAPPPPADDNGASLN